MRLHEQLGGPKPDDEVEALKASWRQLAQDGAEDAQGNLCCPDCQAVTSDGQRCGECFSEQASYYTPDELSEEGGQG